MATRLLVKEMAEFRNFSKRKLMFASQVDIKTLQRIWKDPYTTITTETLDKLSTALGVDVSLLVESDPPLLKNWQEMKDAVLNKDIVISKHQNDGADRQAQLLQ